MHNDLLPYVDIFIAIVNNVIYPNNNRMCVYCVWEISEQLNQENGKSYGTGFFGKVQR